MDKKRLIHQWYETYHQDTYNFLVYYIGSRDVEDLVQEVFIKAFQKLEKYESRSEPKTWLLAISRNVAIDFFRKNKAHYFLPESFLYHMSSRDKNPQELLLEDETKNELYRLINQLKPTYRDIIILRGIMELTPDEVASVVNWSKTRVNLTFHRAIGALKKSSLINMGGNHNEPVSERESIKPIE
ncbi:RNA polymerase sigma factor [Peribacillus sp. SCS-155]|uniref:RNA polymerase sigma factor n=1 Tax=Peribacillus sedimenti TaxID=3115297 RepID=UPI003905D684